MGNKRMDPLQNSQHALRATGYQGTDAPHKDSHPIVGWKGTGSKTHWNLYSSAALGER